MFTASAHEFLRSVLNTVVFIGRDRVTARIKNTTLTPAIDPITAKHVASEKCKLETERTVKIGALV